MNKNRLLFCGISAALMLLPSATPLFGGDRAEAIKQSREDYLDEVNLYQQEQNQKQEEVEKNRPCQGDSCKGKGKWDDDGI